MDTVKYSIQYKCVQYILQCTLYCIHVYSIHVYSMQYTCIQYIYMCTVYTMVYIVLYTCILYACTNTVYMVPRKNMNMHATHIPNSHNVKCLWSGQRECQL